MQMWRSVKMVMASALVALPLAALADEALVKMDDDKPTPGVVTIEMKTSFLRAGLGRLTAHGTLLHRTASMAFTEGEVRDEKGELVAHATGTFKYMKALPAGGRRIQRLNASD